MEDKENDPLALVELGEKFRKFLIYHGVSYSELAKQVDILTRDTVQLMTAGARDRFTSKNLLRCLKGLVILEKLYSVQIRVRDYKTGHGCCFGMWVRI